MMYTMNPFVIVSESDGHYALIGRENAGNIDALTADFSAAQMALMIKLMDGSFLPEEEIRHSLGNEMVDGLISHEMLINMPMDTTSMDSRTEGFYRMHGMDGAGEMLREKSVLILGAGGIGTHMAWHMNLFGVGHMTIVDFDTVEESNLNRQLLFDRNDIGCSKVDVLVKKLHAIRPNADIQGIKCRIDSIETLRAICTGRCYDLIIKALDSPAAFPLWLDAICREQQIAYVAGITMGSNAVIGPTFLPGRSEVGWTDILPVVENSRRIGGIAPSIGMMLSHISDALAAECFKVLTGQGNLAYAGRVCFENIFTGQKQAFGKGGVPYLSQ